MANNEQITEKPEVTDEHRARAREMAKANDESRPTVAMPGTGNTVTGQSVGDWLNDDGTPKFGEVEQGDGVKLEDDTGGRAKGVADEE